MLAFDVSDGSSVETQTYRTRAHRPIESTFATGKSRGSWEAIIPIYDALRQVLNSIPKCSPTILTNTHRPPMEVQRFQHGI